MEKEEKKLVFVGVSWLAIWRLKKEEKKVGKGRKRMRGEETVAFHFLFSWLSRVHKTQGLLFLVSFSGGRNK